MSVVFSTDQREKNFPVNSMLKKEKAVNCMSHFVVYFDKIISSRIHYLLEKLIVQSSDVLQVYNSYFPIRKVLYAVLVLAGFQHVVFDFHIILKIHSILLHNLKSTKIDEN